MSTRNSLDDFRPNWKARFAQLPNFGFSEEESEFTLGWEGVPEKSRIEIRFSPKAYRVIYRAIRTEKGQDELLNIEPKIIQKKTVLHISHYQLAMLHYIIMFVLIPKLNSEKHRRISRNKGEISQLVQCMLEKENRIGIGEIHYEKGNYIIPYTIGRNPGEAIGRSVSDVIQDFQKVLDRLTA